MLGPSLKLSIASSSFKQATPVRPDRAAGCEQPFGSARVFIPGDHNE